jgi:hypothetical protein
MGVARQGRSVGDGAITTGVVAAPARQFDPDGCPPHPPLGRSAWDPLLLAGGACEEGRHDVRGVPVEGNPRAVVAHGRPGVGVTRRLLHVSQRDAGRRRRESGLGSRPGTHRAHTARRRRTRDRRQRRRSLAWWSCGTSRSGRDPEAGTTRPQLRLRAPTGCTICRGRPSYSALAPTPLPPNRVSGPSAQPASGALPGMDVLFESDHFKDCAFARRHLPAPRGRAIGCVRL